MTEVIGWNVFGVAIAVLGIVIAFVIHKSKSQRPPKE